MSDVSLDMPLSTSLKDGGESFGIPNMPMDKQEGFNAMQKGMSSGYLQKFKARFEWWAVPTSTARVSLCRVASVGLQARQCLQLPGVHNYIQCQGLILEG